MNGKNMTDEEIDTWSLNTYGNYGDGLACDAWVEREYANRATHAVRCDTIIRGDNLREIRANLILHINETVHVPQPPPYTWRPATGTWEA